MYYRYHLFLGINIKIIHDLCLYYKIFLYNILQNIKILKHQISNQILKIIYKVF